MRGTLIHRMILAWICILSLTFAGCAAKPSSLPADGSRSGTVRVLAVIGTENIPEFNVVRMGNSRVVGALQGAGRGFLDGVAAVALRAQIVRTTDGTTLFEKTLKHRSDAIPVEEWVKDDFLRLLRELDDGVRDLAKRCVNDILGAGLVPTP